MSKIEDGWYKFGDSRNTEIHTRYFGAAIITRGFWGKRIYLSGVVATARGFLAGEIHFSDTKIIGKVSVKADSIWRRKFRENTEVKDVLMSVGVSEFQAINDTETLKRVLKCHTVREFEESVIGKSIHEVPLLSIINDLYRAMYVLK